MATECKCALHELALILASLSVFVSEEKEGKWSVWMKEACRPYPNCLAGSAKGDGLQAKLQELQTKFNKLVELPSSFGWKVRGCRAFGQSVLVVIPDEVATKLEQIQPTGLLAVYKGTDDSTQLTF